MKAISLISIGVLLIATPSIPGAPYERNSLEIIRHLRNMTCVNNRRVKIVCKVKNAKSYYWYKDGKLLNQSNPSFMVKGRKLFIKQFSETLVGIYECEGRDGKGNSGRTRAKLNLKLADPCKPQRESQTECFQFDKRKCPNITSFAPKAENLNVQIRVDYEKKPWSDIWFLVKWNVPMQGTKSIWGWQIRIFGLENNPGYYQCYQVNSKYSQINRHRVITEQFAVPVLQGTYMVEVQSLPHNNTAGVRKMMTTPGLCEISDNRACCESYVNASLAVSNYSTTLSWRTHYPASLNVSIDGFIITWSSQPDGICDTKSVFLDPIKYSYTFRNLTSDCGNYTIILEVAFANVDLGCGQSKHEELLYIPPPVPVEEPNTITSSPNEAMATAGFTVAAILGGIVIVALIYYCKIQKEPESGVEPLGMQNGEIQDSRITSSSFWEGLPPQEGRLHGTASWSSSGNDKNQWIQVDLCKEKDVTVIATQGRKDADQWVESYVVSYSMDGEIFEHYQVDGVCKVFNGNTNKNSVETNMLSPPITARYIRIHPQSWYNHISMRIELYGQSGVSKGVKVFILNPHHCDLCTGVLHALGTLLIGTGRIRCEIDIFASMQEITQGLAIWTQDMILNSDYVIIPWLCKITPPKQDNKVTDMDTLIFLSSLDFIEGELLRNRNKKNKFIPVCLDHCSLEVLPTSHVLLQTYNIPSRIDDLVMNLLGKTRRQPDTKWPILEFDDQDYLAAKRNLEQAANKMKKNHHPRCQKNPVSDTSKKERK